MRRIPHPDTEAAKGHDRATTRGATLAPSLSLVSRASSRSHNILARQPIESRTLRLCLVASAERHLGPSAFPAVKRRPERPGSNPTQPQSKRLAHTLLTYDTPYISNTAAGEAGPGDTHTHSTLRPFSSKLPSSMGYYTRAETVTLAATAQSKIAVSVFLGIAGGLSRTESSFANLDWLLVRGPP